MIPIVLLTMTLGIRIGISNYEKLRERAENTTLTEDYQAFDDVTLIQSLGKLVKN